MLLKFWWKEFGDETHSTDGVYFSNDDGATFVKVQNLNGASYTNNTWYEFNLDVDQLAANNSLAFTNTFVIKFQQYDNYAIATDGFAFDDISVYKLGPQPPVAEANGPYYALPGAAINFSSAGSNDPDGSITAYLWTFGDGNTSTQANPTHTYAANGTYNVTLKVTDNTNMEATDNTTATVADAPAYITAEIEPNSGATTASGPVGTGVNVAGEISSSTDDDWYYFEVNSAGNINISVAIGNSADLDWFLYAENNTSTYLVRGYTTSNPEAGSYNAAVGKYYLMVDGYQGATATYTLSITGGLAKFTNQAPEKNDIAAEETIEEVPTEYALGNPYPNPFNPGTNVTFALPQDEVVNLVVYNILGEVVRTLVTNELYNAGGHNFYWDGKNNNSQVVPSGVYIIQLKAGSFVKSVKAMLLK